MAFPALLKSPYVLGSAGAVGVGGVSVAAWSGSGDGIDYSKVLQSKENVKARSDLIERFVTGDWMKNDRCFSELFPKSEVLLKTPTFNVSSNSFTAQAPSSDSSNTSSPQACAFVQHSHLGDKAFIFQMEITVRNDNVGLALWVAGNNVDANVHDSKIKSKTGNNIQYYLAFMEKVGGDVWVTKGGYSWYDRYFAYASENDIVLNANIDGKPMYPGIGKFLGITSEMPYKDEEWKHDAYFGHWKGDSNYGKEVFEGIEIWRYNKSDAEILGKDYSKTFESENSKGYSKESTTVLKYEYVKPKSGEAGVSEGWHLRRQVPVSALDNWYKPFKGKKGTWVKSALVD